MASFRHQARVLRFQCHRLSWLQNSVAVIKLLCERPLIAVRPRIDAATLSFRVLTGPRRRLPPAAVEARTLETKLKLVKNSSGEFSQSSEPQIQALPGASVPVRWTISFAVR